MPLQIVRVSFCRPGDSSPTNRHYPVPAETPDKALEIVKAWKPFTLASVPGVQFGHVPGSIFKVTGTAYF